MSDNFSSFLNDGNMSHHHYADSIIKRTMTHLHDKNIDLISAETDVATFSDLQRIAQHMTKTCGRVVILTSQDEFTYLIMAKSANVQHLYVDEIVSEIASNYGAHTSGDAYSAMAQFHQQNITPELIDTAVESAIIAIPFLRS